MCSEVLSTTNKCLVWLMLLSVGGGVVVAAEKRPVVLGLSTVNAAALNAAPPGPHNGRKRMAAVYAENGIEASYVDYDSLFHKDLNDAELDRMLDGFHVVVVIGGEADFAKVTAKDEARAKRVGAALARYVQKGGGLLPAAKFRPLYGRRRREILEPPAGAIGSADSA